MTKQVDFYFDFSSPYGYLAAQTVDDLAERHGADLRWRPILLGAVFKKTGAAPLVDLPLKGDYARRDMARCARRLGVTFTFPETFPFSSVAASRAFYWLHERDPAQARALAKALYHAVFGEGRSIEAPEEVAAVAGELGLDPSSVKAALEDPEVKARLRQEVEAAVAAGVFGSPFFIVDGEPFWGHDRMDEVERWLRTGGW